MSKLYAISMAVCALLLSSSAQADDAETAAAVKAAVETLQQGDVAARIEAMDHVGDLGEDAAGAVPALIEALGDDDVGVCWHAARTIGAVGPKAAEAVPALTEALASEEAKVRTYAAFALGRIGQAAVPAVPALMKAFTDADPMVRRAVVEAIPRIDADREQLLDLFIQAMEDADPAVVVPALSTLAERGEKAVPAMIRALENEKSCYWACLVLSDIGPQAAEAVGPLGQLLDHEDPEVRMHAVLTLGEIGPAAQSAVPAIVARLAGDDQHCVRLAAVYTLGKIGPAEGVPSAIRAAGRENKDPVFRTVAAWAMLNVLPDDENVAKLAAAVFVKGLESEDANVRATAARAIAESEVAVDVVGPALIAALENAEGEVLAQALDALAGVGPSIAGRLVKALDDERKRPFAFHVLYRLGPEAKAVVPELIEALDTDDPVMLAEIQFLLGAIGPASAPAVEALIESLASDDLDVCASACFALGKIGKEAAAAETHLHKLLENEEDHACTAAVWALVQIAPQSEDVLAKAIPLLIEGLGDMEREIKRIEIARVLGQLGSAAEEAVPALETALEDESPRVRAAAADAIEKIGQ